MVGGAAVCIGLLAEMNVPDANALSILLPGGNGNATQINIFEGNIFRPQFGLGGNGSNTSNNRTIGGIIFGGQDPTGESHVIALGGAKGTGNVTQINIASYNIFNPQTSIFGNNSSANTTISNVSAGQRQRGDDHERRRGRTGRTFRPRPWRRKHDAALVVVEQHLQPAVQPVRLESEPEHGGDERVRGQRQRQPDVDDQRAGSSVGRSTQSPAAAIRPNPP